MTNKEEMQMKKDYKEIDKIHKNRKIRIDILKEKIIREDERKKLNDFKFYKHIKSHLKPEQEVICKICNKTYKEIIKGSD